jgi:hypothetical protein
MTTQDFIRERIIEIRNVNCFGLLFAIKGLRLSYNSQIDSVCKYYKEDECVITLGTKDYKLLKALITKDDSECKFLRQIKVQCFIKAPRYWWIEFDTYKVGVVCQSESTMHTLRKQINSLLEYEESNLQWHNFFSKNTLPEIMREFFRMYSYKHFLDDTGKLSINKLKANLPEGFLQTRAVDFNYGVLRTMYRQRKNHKLEEWKEFCEWVKTLPYSWLIKGNENEK